MTSSEDQDINLLKRQIVQLKKSIQSLKFKNSKIYRVLNIFNIITFILFFQYAILYFFSINRSTVNNRDISFKSGSQLNDISKIYVLYFNYNNYTFRVKINKQLPQYYQSKNITIVKDLVFNIPQKIQFDNDNRWFIVTQSLPVLTICCIMLFITIISYIYRLNDIPNSLFSLTFFNSISVLGIIFYTLYFHNFF